jgi:hypothetical protein
LVADPGRRFPRVDGREIGGAGTSSRLGSRARIPRSGFTEAVTTVVNETPTGAAGGALYAALTAYLGLDQFALENSSRSTTPVSRVAPATSGPLVTSSRTLVSV